MIYDMFDETKLFSLELICPEIQIEGGSNYNSNKES